VPTRNPELFEVGVIPTGAVVQAKRGISHTRNQRKGDPSPAVKSAGLRDDPRLRMHHCRRHGRVRLQSPALPRLEIDPHTELRGEGNAHRCARTEEVSETAGRNGQLLQA
jgi:hypothetical protein